MASSSSFFKSQDEQLGSSMSRIKEVVYDPISCLGSAGKTVTDSFIIQDEQEGSSMIKPCVYAAMSYMACAGKPVPLMRMAKFVMIIFLLVSCSEPVAALPSRPLNKMKMMRQPRVLVTEDARGPVPPIGPSGCTRIPVEGGKCVGKNEEDREFYAKLQKEVKV